METRKFELGSMDGVPETRIHRERFNVRTQTRSTKYTAYVSIDANISNQDSWNTVRNCAVNAAIATGVAAICTQGVATFPAFWAAFSICITPHGIDIAQNHVRLNIDTTHGDWH